jgi:hypothetical protein
MIFKEDCMYTIHPLRLALLSLVPVAALAFAEQKAGAAASLPAVHLDASKTTQPARTAAAKIAALYEADPLASFTEHARWFVFTLNAVTKGVEFIAPTTGEKRSGRLVLDKNVHIKIFRDDQTKQLDRATLEAEATVFVNDEQIHPAWEEVRGRRTKFFMLVRITFKARAGQWYVVTQESKQCNDHPDDFRRIDWMPDNPKWFLVVCGLADQAAHTAQRQLVAGASTTNVSQASRPATVPTTYESVDDAIFGLKSDRREGRASAIRYLAAQQTLPPKAVPAISAAWRAEASAVLGAKPSSKVAREELASDVISVGEAGRIWVAMHRDATRQAAINIFKPTSRSITVSGLLAVNGKDREFYHLVEKVANDDSQTTILPTWVKYESVLDRVLCLGLGRTPGEWTYTYVRVRATLRSQLNFVDALTEGPIRVILTIQDVQHYDDRTKSWTGWHIDGLRPYAEALRRAGASGYRELVHIIASSLLDNTEKPDKLIGAASEEGFWEADDAGKRLAIESLSQWAGQANVRWRLGRLADELAESLKAPTRGRR